MPNDYTYVIAKDGYDIYKNGRKFMEQREPFISDGRLSYEENAQAQIEKLIEADKKTAETIPLEELNRADIDYLFMVMEV